MKRVALLLAFVAGCSSAPEKRPGGYYKDDGPGDNAKLASIADAFPKAEPLHRYANRPYVAMGRKYVPLTRVGTYTQRGSLGRVDGNYSCVSGEAGAFTMFAMQWTLYGMSAGISGQNQSCRFDGFLGGITGLHIVP